MSVKGGKLGEIHLDDTHTILLFSKDDRRLIEDRWINKLVCYNSMIEETMDELLYQKKEIERMIHYKDNKKMVWSFRHKNQPDSARFYNSFMRLEREFEKLLDERRRLMDDFHTNAIKCYNDKTLYEFEPIDSACIDDLIVLPGVSLVNQQVTSETFKRWEYFGLGRSLIPPYYDQSDLQDPISRFYIKSHGSFAAIGDIIRLLVISPSDMPTDDIGEVCVANAQTGGQILFRTVLNKLIHHDADNHFLCTSSNIYTVSRR